MKLHDQMQRAVRTVNPDVDRLARVSGARGARVVRRRRGLAVGGAAATVGALAVILSVLGSGLAPVLPPPEPATTPSATFNPSETGRITGRGVVAGLRYAVSQVQDGTAANLTGQDPNPGNDSIGANGELEWTETGVPGVSVIDLGVETGSGSRYDALCTDYMSGVAMGPVGKNCHSMLLPDGSRLITYEHRQRVHDGVGIRRVAELKRTDGTLVRATSTNGFELVRQFDWDITRPEPALSYAQLKHVVSLPWWGAQLPTYFLDQGRDLDPYRPITPFGA